MSDDGDQFPSVELTLQGVTYRLEFADVTGKHDLRLLAETTRAGSPMSTTSLMGMVADGHFSPATVAGVIYLARLQSGQAAPWDEIAESVTFRDVAEMIDDMVPDAEAAGDVGGEATQDDANSDDAPKAVAPS